MTEYSDSSAAINARGDDQAWPMEVKDHRDAKTKAKDRFTNSVEGRNLIAFTIARTGEPQHIRYRFEAAFCAGYEAGKADAKGRVND